jgi:hypothetical protein
LPPDACLLRTGQRRQQKNRAQPDWLRPNWTWLQLVQPRRRRSWTRNWKRVWLPGAGQGGRLRSGPRFRRADSVVRIRKETVEQDRRLPWRARFSSVFPSFSLSLSFRNFSCPRLAARQAFLSTRLLSAVAQIFSCSVLYKPQPENCARALLWKRSRLENRDRAVRFSSRLQAAGSCREPEGENCGFGCVFPGFANVSLTAGAHLTETARLASGVSPV